MAGFFDLPGWAVTLARRALYFWIRTSVFPQDVRELGIDPAKPVCYVLQDRHLSNRLVLFAETEHLDLPSAGRPLDLGGERLPSSVIALNPTTAWRVSTRERYAPPPDLARLIDWLAAHPERELQLIPVVILWGRTPDKQKSILRALLAEAWRYPGPLRRLLTILVHGRNVLIRFNAPISIPAAAAAGGDPAAPAQPLERAQATRKLARVLRVHFRRQREMAIGPDLSHRHTQIDTVIATTAVQRAIDEETRRLGISPEAATKHAHRFALEIVSDYSYSVVRAFEIALTWVWTRLYDGIEVHHLDTLTRIAPGATVVYVPTHRSHIDYLLLSYLLHEHGFTPPHIAAGANLNLPVVGALLRRCGAFFLRRSFKGEPLYATIFDEYLHTILTRGFPLEYFIEGGRSRTGRTLKPKAGILGMTIGSYLRSQTRPLVFVPVYVGYEKTLEGATYVKELAGKPKQKESLWGLLLATRQLRNVFGKVHVNFGEPLVLADFLSARVPEWRDVRQPLNHPQTREITQAAALELARRMNDAVVINPVNLVSLILLATPRHTIDRSLFERLLAHYRSLAEDVPYAAPAICCAFDVDAMIAQAERLGFVERISHPLGEMLGVRGGTAPTLAYFRNNVAHVFALPALIACLVDQNRQIDPTRLGQAIGDIYELIRAELFLHWPEEALPALTTTLIRLFVARGLLRQDATGNLAAPEATSPAAIELHLIGETIRPFLERHFLLLSLVKAENHPPKSRQTVEDTCLLLAQRLTVLYGFGAPEPADKTSYASLLAHLIDIELIGEDEGGALHLAERLQQPLAHTELILSAEVRQAIRLLAASVPQNAAIASH